MRLPIPEGRNARIQASLWQPFAVVGYIPYLALRGKIGSLLLARADESGVLRFAGAVARGLSARMRIQLAILLERDHVTVPSTIGLPRLGVERWVVPRYTAEIKFSGWGRSGDLRFPKFLRLR